MKMIDFLQINPGVWLILSGLICTIIPHTPFTQLYRKCLVVCAPIFTAFMITQIFTSDIAIGGLISIAGIELTTLRIDNLSMIFYSISLLTILSILLVAITGIAVSRKTLRTIKQSVANLASISNGDYTKTLEMKGNNELTALTNSITSMRIKIGFDVEDANKKAAASTRIKEALDNVSANVMVADPNRNIIYMNDSVIATLRNAEADIQKDLPNFDAPRHAAAFFGDLVGAFGSYLGRS